MQIPSGKAACHPPSRHCNEPFYLQRSHAARSASRRARLQGAEEGVAAPAHRRCLSPQADQTYRFCSNSRCHPR